MAFAPRLDRIFLLALALAGECQAAAPCAESIAALRNLVADPSFPMTWHETTMDDGKPMVLSIVERDSHLFLEFVKTGEGLWASSASVVCRNGNVLEASFSRHHVTPGPAASWTIRYILGRGGRFTLTRLGADRLRIATRGWSGTFSSRADMH
jgi:hypothetical protein